jgi:hypothetical protein
VKDHSKNPNYQPRRRPLSILLSTIPHLIYIECNSLDLIKLFFTIYPKWELYAQSQPEEELNLQRILKFQNWFPPPTILLRLC